MTNLGKILKWGRKALKYTNTQKRKNKLDHLKVQSKHLTQPKLIAKDTLKFKCKWISLRY